MVTATIYSNSALVVVDIGDNGEVPWLEETTYLLNKAGKTTATIAQTVQPSSQTGTGPSTLPFVAGSSTAFDASTASVTRESFLLHGQATPSSSSSSSSAAPPPNTITTPPSPLTTSLQSLSSSPTSTATDVAVRPPSTSSVVAPAATPSKPLILNTAMGVAAAILTAVLIGAVYYFYRRHYKKTAYKRSNELSAEAKWISPSFSPTSINMEGNTFAARAMREEMKSLAAEEKGEIQQTWSQQWPQEKPTLDREPGRFAKSDRTPIAHYSSDLSDGYDQQEKRLYGLRDQNQRTSPQQSSSRPSRTIAIPQGSSLPPLPKQTVSYIDALSNGVGNLPTHETQRSPDIRFTHNEYVSTVPPTAQNGSTIPQAITNLTSILKPPPTEPKSLLSKAQSLFTSTPDYKPTFADPKPQVRNKGVTFGEDQIREFGLTPVGSSVGSSDDLYENADSTETEMGDTGSQSRKRGDRRLGHDVEGEVWKTEARNDSRRR
ncbi:MAG: hypothetical protein M1830_008975 [Pleopsidium flavum]|nr:MAG: hypothetical protein M1830_008975 [Pleopsidium flavum]